MDAPYDTIKKAYLSAANKCHPDKTERLSPDLIKLASLKMAQLNDIWETLKDDDHRAAYVASLYEDSPSADDSKTAHGGETNQHSNNSADQDEKSKAENSIDQVAPWSRWLARTIDYTVFIAILITLIQLFWPSIIAWFDDLGKIVFASRSIGFLLFTIVLGFFASLCWVLVEGLLLSGPGSTFGKWLLQINLLDRKAEKLTFAAALKRSFRVWKGGMACGLFGLSFLANFRAYRKLKNDKISRWDDTGEITVLHEKIGPLRFTIVLIFFVQSSFLVFISWGTYQKTPPTSMRTALITSEPNAPQAPSADTETKQAVKAAVETATLPADMTTPKTTVPPDSTAVSTTLSTVASTVEPTTEHQQSQRKTLPPTITPVESAVPTSELTNTSILADPVNSRHNNEPALLQPIPQEARISAAQDQFDRQSASDSTPVRSDYRANRDQVIACMEAYFAIMHKATELPLGDYVRLNKQASREKDRCLSGG